MAPLCTLYEPVMSLRRESAAINDIENPKSLLAKAENRIRLLEISRVHVYFALYSQSSHAICGGAMV